MGTKNKPGDYDCYANADPDEPMFILLARDPSAPLLVELWARMKADADPGEEAMEIEAIECARAMREWREKHRPGKKLKVVRPAQENSVVADYIEGAMSFLHEGQDGYALLEKALAAANGEEISVESEPRFKQEYLATPEIIEDGDPRVHEDLDWGKSEPSDSSALPPEGAFILVSLPDNRVRVVRVTKHADKAGGHNRAYVRYPDGTSDCVVEHVMKEIPYTEEGRIALEYLFECARKEARRSEGVFGRLKNICRSIKERDAAAPEFFSEYDKRPTSDEEMALEIHAWVTRFSPLE